MRNSNASQANREAYNVRLTTKVESVTLAAAALTQAVGKDVIGGQFDNRSGTLATRSIRVKVADSGASGMTGVQPKTDILVSP